MRREHFLLAQLLALVLERLQKKWSPSFECFSLRLSRACLGKMLIFVWKKVGEHPGRFFSCLLLEEEPLGVGGRPTAVGRKQGWRRVHRLPQKRRLFHLAFDLSVSWQMVVLDEKLMAIK